MRTGIFVYLAHGYILCILKSSWHIVCPQYTFVKTMYKITVLSYASCGTLGKILSLSLFLDSAFFRQYMLSWEEFCPPDLHS